MSGLFSDATVVATLISALVSVGVASASGAFAIFQSRRHIVKLRDELFERAKIDGFLNSAGVFKVNYRLFKSQIGSINQQLQSQGHLADGTEVVQITLDFLAESRSFYEDNRSIIKNDLIDKILNEIQYVIDNGRLNDHSSKERMHNIQNVFTKSINVIDLIYQSTLDR